MNIREDVLNNPAWHALTGPHREFALGFGDVRRYPPDVAPFAAVEVPTVDALGGVAAAIKPGGAAAVLTLDPIAAPPRLEIASTGIVLQMIAREFRGFGGTAVLATLGAADVPAMLALVELTLPGPFAQRTIEMGRYVGIKDDGRLVAMAGERMRPDGFTEVSAVCVHPDHRGSGYAKALVSTIAEAIVARGDTPFLHVFPDNRPAIATYEGLGFTARRLLNFTLLQHADAP